MVFRLATINDIDKVMKCINDAKRYLKNAGSKQWNEPDGYPTKLDMLNDINLNRLYVGCIIDDIAIVFVLAGYEEGYNNPFGKWLIDTNNYLTIYRIAVNNDYRNKGIAKEALSFAINYAKINNYDSIRVDTHEINIPMRSLLESFDFELCGHIFLKRPSDDTKRLIYEYVI